MRLFGAKVGEGVIMRPRLRVKFPWKLSVGARSWIGEGVWIHNQDRIDIGNDVVVSQESFLTTGTHAFRGDMALETHPVVIEDGVWITTRCVVLAGSRIRRAGSGGIAASAGLPECPEPATGIHPGARPRRGPSGALPFLKTALATSGVLRESIPGCTAGKQIGGSACLSRGSHATARLVQRTTRACSERSTSASRT